MDMGWELGNEKRKELCGEVAVRFRKLGEDVAERFRQLGALGDASWAAGPRATEDAAWAELLSGSADSNDAWEQRALSQQGLLIAQEHLLQYIQQENKRHGEQLTKRGLGLLDDQGEYCTDTESGALAPRGSSGERVGESAVERPPQQLAAAKRPRGVPPVPVVQW